VTNGIEISERLSDAFALADLQRLAGCVLLRQSRRDRARRAFEAAVDIAYRQNAGLYLLRAGRDLARLLAEGGDVAGAREILSQIAEGIPEHRTGLDFDEASKLLSKLSSQRASAS
jgi:tetratricopeptide (TPR) repeat protein